ncbi:RPA-interacting protein [Lampetra fluviatilis]
MEARGCRQTQLRARYKRCLAPAWKQQLRERCVTRFRESRYDLLSRFRHLAPHPEQDQQHLPTCSGTGSPVSVDAGRDGGVALAMVNAVLQEEWDALQSSYNDGFPEPEDAPFVEELRQELLSEALSYELEELRRLDEEMLHEAVGRLHDHEGDLLCPACARGHVLQGDGRLTCPCGLDLRTRASAPELRARLCAVMHTHGQVCACRPSFQQMDNTLLAFCQVCDSLEVVL